jgi:hypothetical protein
MGVSVGSLDLPDQPDEPSRAEHADASRLAPKPRELPDPEERGRYYEAMQAHVSAEAAEEAEQGSQSGQSPDVAGQRGYRDEVPRFREVWAKHEGRWPATRQSAVDPPSDASGPHYKDDDVPPSPERHADTSGVITWAREAETPLSADAREIQQENGYDGRLEGFKFRLKDEDRLKDKIAEQMEAEPDKSPAEILRKIPDAIRYTFCFQPESYARGYYDVKERFESRGYEMYYSRNWWTDPEYKGINTRWETTAGQRFEVQFHTPDSFHAKHHVTHVAYERIRNPTTSRRELRELHAFQRQVSSWIKVPDGAVDIPDFKKEGF